MAQNEGRTLRRAPKSPISHLLLFIVMVFAALAFGMTVHVLKAAAESRLTGIVKQDTTAETNPGTATSPDTAQPLLVSSNPLKTIPDCTPANYVLPTPINLAGLPAGLTTVRDGTQHYVVYGNSAEERLKELQKCAPTGEYAGAASYQITWQYGYSVRTDGLCVVVQPKVGLHLAMILPDWLPGSTTNENDRAVWSSYIAALNMHEQGHYDISRQYAKTMLQQLHTLPAQSCSSITNKIDALLQGRLAQLQAAQNNYDATTNHGATQGAVL